MNKLNELKELAEKVSGGHYTILKFTKNYRVALGTLSPDCYFDYKLQIDDMPSGETLDEAIDNCLKEEFNLLNHEGYGIIRFDDYDKLISMTRKERFEFVERKTETFFELHERIRNGGWNIDIKSN